MKYQVIVSGTINGTYNTKEEAEKRLYEIKHSFLAMIHPIDTIYIKKLLK